MRRSPLPARMSRIAPYLRQAVASRQTVTHEFQTVSATGQYVIGQVNSVPHLDEQGNVLGLLALSLDVTKQRQAEEALRASEERYRLLVENMREGLAVVDEDALLTYVNDSMCAMTGWARDELLGHRSVKLFPAEDQERHQDWLARRRAGFSDSYEAVFQRRDGGRVPVLVSASPILDPQGNYRGSLAVCTDITERVEAEETLRQRVEELTVLNRIAHTMAAEAELPITPGAGQRDHSRPVCRSLCAHHLAGRRGGGSLISMSGASPIAGQAGPTRFAVFSGRAGRPRPGAARSQIAGRRRCSVLAAVGPGARVAGAPGRSSPSCSSRS